MRSLRLGFAYARWIAVVVTIVGFAAGCVGGDGGGAGDGAGTGSAARREFPLDTLPTASLELSGKTVKAWLARTTDQQSEGLMYVTEDDIADDEAMLFVFPDERIRGFWMKNTLISLDIAYARMDGTIVAIHTMPPLTLNTYSSFEPAMFALEMKAGAFERLSVRVGDRISIPAEVFKTSP